MGLLEQVSQLKKEGIPDREIITRLQESGISPKQINDALNQAQIKNAIFREETDSMQPSIMQAPPNPRTQEYIPSTQESAEEEMYGQNQNQGYFPQQDYAPQEDYNYSESSNTDTIIEIAQQVFSEKIKKIEKQVDSFNEFKTLQETKIENISDRLRRIENMFDKLQIEILEKIGSYGKNLETTKKEVEMLEDSFKKMIEPVLDHKTKHSKK